jgi:DNA polymerase-4
VRAALEELAPVVQAASIDEFYLDFTGTERLLEGESLAATGRRVQARVFDAAGIRVSVGGGTNRLIAKLAVSRAKPNGVFVVPPGEEAAFTRELELHQLPGVGPTLMDTLAKKGLTTVRDALKVDHAWLVRWLGDTRARWLAHRMQGRDDTPVTSRDPRKSISSERTFSRDLQTDAELENHLLRLTVSVATTLRDEGLRARTLTVKLRDRDFTTRQRSITFPEAVTSERALYPEARRLLGELRARRRVPARLLGVGLGSLEDADAPRQLGLFSDTEDARGETARDRSLSRAVDDLRARFGDDAVLPGRIAGTRPPGRPDRR